MLPGDLASASVVEGPSCPPFASFAPFPFDFGAWRFCGGAKGALSASELGTSASDGAILVERRTPSRETVSSFATFTFAAFGAAAFLPLEAACFVDVEDLALTVFSDEVRSGEAHSPVLEDAGLDSLVSAQTAQNQDSSLGTSVTPAHLKHNSASQPERRRTRSQNRAQRTQRAN